MEPLKDYDYELPEELIAQLPLPDRAASRLLWLHGDSGRVEHRRFRDIVEILSPGDLLVLNDTKVTALRLFGKKPSGGRVELLLIQERHEGSYEALVKPGRRLKPGALIQLEGRLQAEIESDLGGGLKLVRFPDTADLPKRLAEIGQIPLPPYVHEALEDPGRYQTVYASQAGSSAAPTAGLHFTPELLSALKTRGTETARVTLSVGLDTFRPIQAEDVSEHKMHGERCVIKREAADAISRCKGRIIAVGTTVVRTLESFATGPRQVGPGEQLTRLFIRPGFRFQVVDGMLTNFHMPRTSMLALVSALAGRQNVMRAYAEAVTEKYRFLSFGDSMFILPSFQSSG